MIERPDIDDGDLARWVRAAWGLDVVGLGFLPFGLDGWAFRVTTPDDVLFLKVKREAPGPAATLLPVRLREHGITQVVAPIPTAAGALAATGRYCLLLYPYVDGDDLWDAGLTAAQWVEYGEFLGRLHRLPAEAGVGLPVESFTTSAPERMRALAGGAARDPYAAGLWTAHGDRVLRLADDVDRLAGKAAAAGGAHVVCHTDIHPGNLLADPAGGLHAVDWDAPMLAPRERDLMFVFHHAFGAHPIDPDREARFRAGYGPLELDPALLAYYRAERALDDIAQFTASVLDDALGEVTRRDELRLLRRCLADLVAHPDVYAG